MTVLAVADPFYGPSNCRDCGAPIVWTMTETGNRLAVDLEPAPRGTLLLFTEEILGELVDPGVHRVRRATSDDPAEPRWIVHFATCPRMRSGA